MSSRENTEGSQTRRKRDIVRDAIRPQNVADMLRDPTQRVFKAMNPKNIVEKMQPGAQSVARLLKPIVKPKKQVNWLRNQLTWKKMKAPLSAVFALVLGGLAAVLSQSSTGITLSPPSVIGITTIVLELGSTERFYVRSALRVAGTVVGSAIGLGLGSIGVLIGDDRTGDNVVALQAYRLAMVAVSGFVTFAGMTIFSDTAYMFLMFNISLVSVLYTITLTSAIAAMLSALAGVTVSIITIFIFQFPKADAILAETHKKAVENLLTLARFAVESDPRAIDDFEDCSGAVRKALTSTPASFEIYQQWRKWTCRKVMHNFDSLSVATRPLYYVSYSMYWSLVQSPAATGLGGSLFFCNSAAQFDQHFRMPLMGIQGAIMAIQASLTRILVPDKKDPCKPPQHLEMIVQRHLWFGCMRNVHILKEKYLAHRSDCFSTFTQHWSALDYLHQLINMLLALTAYVHAIAEVFLPEVAEYIYPVLEDICENLGQMRHEGIYRIDHFMNDNLKIHRNSLTNSGSMGGDGISSTPFNNNFTIRSNPDMNIFTAFSGTSRIPRGWDIDEHSSVESSPGALESPTSHKERSPTSNRRRARSP